MELFRQPLVMRSVAVDALLDKVPLEHVSESEIDHMQLR